VRLTINQKYKLGQLFWTAAGGVVAGFLYTLAEDGWQLFHLVNGTAGGFLIAVSVALLELFVFSGKLRRIPFISIFILRVVVYFLLAFAVTFNLFVFSRTLRYNLSYREVLQSDEFRTYLTNEYHLVLAFCFLAIVLGVFTLQMTRKLGLSDLWAFVTGKYRTPKKESRIFMFLSLGESDTIISKTGNLNYHNFINDFIFDISNTILIHQGKIVHYMEDEIVIVWSIRNGTKNANCVRTYFDLCHEIVGYFEYYHTKYGVLPRPKCAIHAGNVIRAEIGEIKSEISFFGDVVNSTSRILSEAVRKEVDILVSQQVMEIIQLPIHYQAKNQGVFTLKGKHHPIQLYSLHLQDDE